MGYNDFAKKQIPIKIAMPRRMLTDPMWKKLKEILQSTGRIYNKLEHRNTLEGILYRMRAGTPWRDIPPKFGKWNTIFRRFNLRSKKRNFKSTF